MTGRRGELTASPTRAFRRLRGTGHAGLEASVGRAEQSNTSVAFGDRLMLKLFRRLEPGINPDIELGTALTDAGFKHAPAVAGWLAYRSTRDDSAAIGILQEFVPNEGDIWEVTLDAVSSFYERAAADHEEGPGEVSSSLADVIAACNETRAPLAREMIGAYLDIAALLGQRTAQLHTALASRSDDPAFAPEPYSALHQRSVLQTMRNQASATFALLGRRLELLPEDVKPQALRALDLADEVLAEIHRLSSEKSSAARIRTHGDYHCGQVLWTGKDVVIIDFEGEPGRPLSDRRHKRSALTDVAGMLRSFHYAAFGTLLNPRVGGAVRAEDVEHLDEWAHFWYLNVAATFLGSYLDEARGQPFLPRTDAELHGVLELATLRKVLYELGYELNNRPEWVSVPLRGLLGGLPGA